MTARILIVDDLPQNLTLLEEKLSQEYYNVITADNGYDALDLAQQEHPDIILLDVMMPGMDGYEVCTHLKGDPLTAHIPIVMISALGDRADKIKGLEAGADDFLTKPIKSMALFARVRSLLRLKKTMDEWRHRAQISRQFGVSSDLIHAHSMSSSDGLITLIDDNRADIHNIKEALNGENHTITVLYSDQIILEHIKDKTDLIIISLTLDDEDSLRIYSQIRADEKTRKLPILVIADEEENERLNKALDLGINDFIMRPIDKYELLVRVKGQIRRWRYHVELLDNYRRNLEASLTDHLTKAYNRRYVSKHLKELIQESHERKRQLSIVMIDIDYFKKINDQYGHRAGDYILQELTARIQDQIRNFDLLARIGGEEFLLVFPSTDQKTAEEIGERLRKVVEEKPFITKSGVDINITISLGLVSLKDETDHTDLIKKADQALYQAKNNGRNRLLVFKR
jgi:two-component system, cell cycle response regulator